MKKLIIICAVICMISVSCKKDFLNRYPQTSIVPQEFFKSESDLSLYVQGLWSFPNKSLWADVATDNQTTTGDAEVNDVMWGTITPKTVSTGAGWNQSDWGRLSSINYFLDHYNTANASQAAKDHYAGLARFYRAQFYFNYVKRFSDVPWYSHVIEPSDTAELYAPRSPRTLVMDSVMADLAFAASHVRANVPVGSPGLWAVKTFYARVALYEGTFRKYHPELKLQTTANQFLDSARDEALDIINSGEFHIYNTGHPNQDYQTLFSSQDLTTNPEVILDRIYNASLPGGGQDVQTGVWGDYENSPARDLVQAYLMKDGTRFTDIPGYENFTYLQEFQNRDPRLMQTYAYPGFIRAPSTTPFVTYFNKNFTGYFELKGYINSTDITTIQSVDLAIYRYAEVLLIYAEAQAELGQLTQSDLDLSINFLRNRVGMPPLNLAAANANPDPILMAKYPNVSGLDEGVILEIRRERRVELAFEDFRFDDLMRWDAGKVLEKIPQGMYFPALGSYDMNGDGVPDIILLAEGSTIPSVPQVNSLGVPLVYYVAGNYGDSGVSLYLSNGNSGTVVTDVKLRNFIEPQDYYRPIPYNETILNPTLIQEFGWQ